ncbi:MAG: phosphoribosyltransferase family protein [Candidatus Bathyarchaeia archaeon]
MNKTRIETAKSFSQLLWRTGTIKFGAFTLANGSLTPYYIDLKVIPSFPSAFREVIRIYINEAENVGTSNYEAIAGMPPTGLIFASVVAYELGKPAIYPRKEAVEWRGKRITGVIKPGERVLIIDDIITTGKSILETAEIVRAEGGVVEDAIVLLDREEDGVTSLSLNGIKLHAFTKVRDVAEALYELQEISEEQRDAILKQVRRQTQ